MKSNQVTKKLTFQLRLDIGWQKILLEERARTGRSMKELVEEVLGDYYGPDFTLAKSIPKKGRKHGK